MKKILLILTLLVTICLGVSCGDTAGEQTPTEHTVSFDGNGGTEYEPVTVGHGERVARPFYPTKVGYSFDGWYFGDELWSFSSDKVTEDITLTAHYIPVCYTISYDLCGGVLNPDHPTSYTIESPSITLPTPSLTGLKFAGWHDGNKVIDSIPSASTGNLSLEAIFYSEIATVTEGDESTLAYVIRDTGSLLLNVYRSKDCDGSDTKIRLDLPSSWTALRVVKDGIADYIPTINDGKEVYVEIMMENNIDKANITPATTSDDSLLVSGYGITLKGGTVVDVNYYPGFTRKAVTFTIDDGRVDTDTIFLDIVRPAGIKGTFNLMKADASSPELYKGYEVANHHKLHCLPMRDNFDYSKIEIKDEIFNRDTSDPKYIYKSTTEGLYYIDYRHYTDAYDYAYWHAIASNETYTEYVDITEEQIESIFGEGAVVGFAYPHGQLNEHVKAYLKSKGYLYARKTGNLKDKTGFALPEDRFAWTYNADVNCMLEVMAKYDALEDDGTLKFFSFGVHSKDFNEKWDVLRQFAALYGNREEDFYYASNREIFEYEDAVKTLIITDDKIINNSDVDVFVTINGKKTIIFAHSEYVFAN